MQQDKHLAAPLHLACFGGHVVVESVARLGAVVQLQRRVGAAAEQRLLHNRQRRCEKTSEAVSCGATPSTGDDRHMSSHRCAQVTPPCRDVQRCAVVPVTKDYYTRTCMLLLQYNSKCTCIYAVSRFTTIHKSISSVHHNRGTDRCAQIALPRRHVQWRAAVRATAVRYTCTLMMHWCSSICVQPCIYGAIHGSAHVYTSIHDKGTRRRAQLTLPRRHAKRRAAVPVMQGNSACSLTIHFYGIYAFSTAGLLQYMEVSIVYTTARALTAALRLPCRAAMCSGVQRSMSRESTSAPAATSMRTHSSLRWRVRWRAVTTADPSEPTRVGY
jgi:hypothetical protein